MNYFSWDWTPARGVPDFWANMELSLGKGVSCASSGGTFPLFEKTPVIVINKATEFEWRKDTAEFAEVWLYFRNRKEWKNAHRLARFLRRYSRYDFFDLDPHRLLEIVPAVKLAKEEGFWFRGYPTFEANSNRKLLPSRV